MAFTLYKPLDKKKQPSLSSSVRGLSENEVLPNEVAGLLLSLDVNTMTNCFEAITRYTIELNILENLPKLCRSTGKRERNKERNSGELENA